MYHLIKKDILMQKKTFLYSLVLILFLVFTLGQTGPLSFVMIIFVITYLLAVNASALEDKNNNDKLLISLPIKRRTIVLSKYVSVFVYAIYAMVLYFIIYVLVKFMNIPLHVYPLSKKGIVAILVAIILFNSINFPFIFKYGYIKSKTATFILFFGIFFGGTYLLDKNPPFIEKVFLFVENASTVELTLTTTLLILFILFVSIFASLKFYKNREF